MRTRSWGCCFCVLLASSVRAQVPDITDLTGVEVRTVVTTDSESLRFEYLIDNMRGTLGVDGFAFSLDSDASREVLDIEGLDNSGDTSFSSTAHRAEFSSDSYVAAAFPVQNEWRVAFDARRNARWSAGAESRVLQVGETRSGLALVTKALPGIREARLRADIIDLLPTEDELDAADLVPADIQAEVEASEQVTSVVAPVAPPATLDLASFATEIEALRVAARTEGWIATDEAANSLGSTLTVLTDALSAGENATAKGLATQFLSEVDASSCTTIVCPGDPPLTSEAFALMHFNMEFLRSNIPNSPPACDAADASPDLFWPPDHALVDVAVINVTDPDGDPVVISFQSVLSDEAVDAGGSGNTCPDAVILADGTLQLRAERAGKLDGRVYDVHYTAADPAEASCSGSVKVCMPHDESETATCVEGALDFDATTCP